MSVDGEIAVLGPLEVYVDGEPIPLDGLAAPLRIVAEWLPITPLVDGMRAVALDGAGMTDLGRPFALLGLRRSSRSSSPGSGSG